MRFLRLATVIGLSFACIRFAASQSVNSAQEKVPTISARIRADSTTARSGAPIILKTILTNQSDHEITFGYDRNQGVCEVDVFDETGEFAPDKRPGYHNGRLDLEQLARTWTPEQLIKSGLLTGHLVWITLKPGESFTEIVDVTKDYDMDRAGRYKVVVQKPDPETKNAVKSNTIEVTVSKSE